MPTRRRLTTALAIVWTVLTLVGCWTPSRNLPGEESPGMLPVPHLDKFIHGAIFAGLGFLWMKAGPSGPRRAAAVFVAGLAMAALTEVVQELPLIGRDAGLDDGAADTLGLALGIAVAWVTELAKGREKSRLAAEGVGSP